MRHILTAAVLAAAVAVSTGCAAAPPPVSEKVQQYYDANKQAPLLTKASATPTVKPVRVAAVGDSITQGDSPNFNTGKLGSLSWPSHLPESFKFVGGWAEHGASTAAVAANVSPVAADVLVIIAGTNDLMSGVPFSDSAANLESVASKVGVKRVVVSSVPPFDENPALSSAYNEQLQALAKSRGWTFVDAMAALRDGDTYAGGMTADGIHPTRDGVLRVAKALAAAMKGLAP